MHGCHRLAAARGVVTGGRGFGIELDTNMMDSDTVNRLQRIGLTLAMLQAVLLALEHDAALHAAHGSKHDNAALRPLEARRVVEVQREHVLLHDGTSEHPARVLPHLLQELQEAGDALAAGDWVLVAPDAHGHAWVHVRVPPQTQVARRLHDGRDKLARVVIVANVDTALLTMGLDLDFNPRRLDRYLLLAQLARVEPVVVLTKADLCDDVDARVALLRERLPSEVQVVAVNGLDAEQAARALSPWTLRGRTLALLGSSGAGKSTLTNALVGTPTQDTGPTRHGDGRGRHTTTARTLHVLTSGACIIDTPGLRTLRLDTDEAALHEAFSDVATLSTQCRFRDCRHEAEPGCAVQAQLSPERLKTYHKLLREASRDTISLLEKQRQMSVWKARSRAGRAVVKAKRGLE